MRLVADSALAHGAPVVGVITEDLKRRTEVHMGLTSLHVVTTLAERKAMMFQLADAFVALPGGYGTLDEFFEFLTIAQLTSIRKPLFLCDVEGYYQRLREFLTHMAGQSFLGAGHEELFRSAPTPEALVDWILPASPSAAPRYWG